MAIVIEAPLLDTKRDLTATEMIVDLNSEEHLLAKADKELGRAIAKYRVAAARYVAVREAIADYLGNSPYDRDTVYLWPDSESQEDTNLWGSYRYLDKDPGVAVNEVLLNADMPLTIQEILETVRSGGLRQINGREIDGRTVNAALLSNKEVIKDADEGTTYVHPANPVTVDEEGNTW